MFKPFLLLVFALKKVSFFWIETISMLHEETFGRKITLLLVKLFYQQPLQIFNGNWCPITLSFVNEQCCSDEFDVAHGLFSLPEVYLQRLRGDPAFLKPTERNVLVVNLPGIVVKYVKIRGKYFAVFFYEALELLFVQFGFILIDVKLVEQKRCVFLHEQTDVGDHFQILFANVRIRNA